MIFKKSLSLILCILLTAVFLPAGTVVSAAEVYTVTYVNTSNNALSFTENKQAGVALTVANCSETKTGYEFLGWADSPTATEPDYTVGQAYEKDESITLYPVWQGQVVQYKVKHYIKSYLKPEYVLYKTETVSSYFGEKTTASALSLAGYTAGTVTNKQIALNGTTIINIYYSMNGKPNSDVNADGTLDMLDAIMLERYLARWDGYDNSNVCLYNADCNIDGKINGNDLLTLLHLLAGNSPEIGQPDTDDEWGDWI